MTPPVTKNLLVINIILYMCMMVFSKWGIDLNDLLGLHFILAHNFRPYQLVTYMFMHANLTHIAFNMFSLWMFGRVIEMTLGGKRFLIFYLLCGIGAGVCQEAVQIVSYYIQGLDHFALVETGNSILPTSAYIGLWTTVGASGSLYGVFLAYGMLYPNERVMLLIPPIPLKAKYLITGLIVFELLIALSSSGDNVAHFAHLGGALAGFLLIRFYRRKTTARSSGFTTWEEYSPHKKSFFEKIKSKFSKKGKEAYTETISEEKEESVSPEELRRILDKIKRSGYDSLTKEEKEKLFRR